MMSFMRTASATPSARRENAGQVGAESSRSRSLPRLMPSSRQWPKLLLAALALATLVGFLVYPTYTTYDSLYSLLWGRELLHGHLPSFQTYRAPTEHPLAIVFGAGLSLFGQAGNRLMIAATLASFVALAAGMYRLAAA